MNPGPGLFAESRGAQDLAPIECAPARRGAAGIALLLAAGAILELGLLAVSALSFQLTEIPALTELVAPRPGLEWRLLFPTLQVLDALYPHVIGPDRTQAAAVAALPLGFAIAAVGYGLAIVVTSRAHVPPRLVLAFIILFMTTLLLMPGFYSSDVVSYAMFGRLAAVDGLNPYVIPPAAAQADPLLAWNGWPHLKSPYGPLWTDLSWGIATLTRALPPAVPALAFRVLSNAVQYANVGLVWWLLGRFGSTTATRLGGLVLFAWNPLVLLETAGNAHNDASMLFLVLLGFVALAKIPKVRTNTDRRLWPYWLLALACIWLGALIKYLPVFAALAVVTAWVAQRRGWTDGLQRLALVGLVGLSATVLLSLPWLDGLSVPGPLNVVLRGGDGGDNALREVAAPWFATNVLASYQPSARAAHTISHAILDAAAETLFGLYLLYELRRLWLRHASGRTDLREIVRASAGLSLAAVLLLLIQVLAWYFVTPLGLASVLGPRSRLAQVTAALTVTFLPVYYLRHYAAGPDELLLAYITVPLVIPAVALARGIAQRAESRQLMSSAPYESN